MESITISMHPIDDAKCEFHLSTPLGETRAHYSTGDDCSAHPIAAAVFTVPGITEIDVNGAVLTVTKKSETSWMELEEQLAYAFEMNAYSTAPPASHADQALNDDELFEKVAEFFTSEINPTVAAHGGKVELIDIENSMVIVRMMGGCQGCGMANVTLRQGIEAGLRKSWPVLKGIVDITDHASGTDPYFTAEKK